MQDSRLQVWMVVTPFCVQSYVVGGVPESVAMSANAIVPVGKATADEGTNETVFKQLVKSGSVKLVLASFVKEMFVSVWPFTWLDCQVLNALPTAAPTVSPPVVCTLVRTLGLIRQWIGVACHMAATGPFTSSCSGL